MSDLIESRVKGEVTMPRKVEFIESYIKVGNDYRWNDNHGELIRCKDCTSCIESKLSNGQRWNYCGRLRCVTEDDGFCAWAERKEEAAKVGYETN